MAQNKSIRNFLLEAIKSLSKEEFDEVVHIFQKEYLHNDEVVFVDGTNDGGCDIKIFENKKEVKKCVQITIQKFIDKKLKDDLKKASIMMTKYRYSNKFDFFCSVSLSEEKIEEYKKYAIDTHDIELDIYEAKRLSQLAPSQVIEYIYSLHSDVVLKPEQMNIDRATKTLYDLLANGKAFSDIKNGFVDSVIISILYEKAPIEISLLKEELECRLGKSIPDIIHLVNNLKSDQRVVKDPNNEKLIRLSEEEFFNVQEVLAFSAKTEKDFCTEFAAILSKYQICSSPEILEELKQLYKFNYSNDIGSHSKNEEIGYAKIFDGFKRYILGIIGDKEEIDNLIVDIRDLCENNSYLNKISAGESFLSLYKSDKLELYLNKKEKDIYLDTPTFVYLLCMYYGIDRNDWDNPFYRSMKSLIKFKEAYPEKIKLFIFEDYLGEVIGEIQKALQYSKFESYPFFDELGGTSNTLYNYYVYLKKTELFEVDDDITSFEDFVYALGADNMNPNDASFYPSTFRFLRGVIEDFDITIMDRPHDDNYSQIKETYERILLRENRNKSETAIRNDVNQVISLLQNKEDIDLYFTTWDTTIYMLRDKVLGTIQGRYNYFNVYNPAKLSNKIALENFNIDESALTNEIFAYADKKYDITNRVKSLLEIIAPYLKEDNKGSRSLLRNLSRLRKQQLEDNKPIDENSVEKKALPVEEIVMMLIPNKEKVRRDSSILDKFSYFMSLEENADYIIDIISQASKLKDYKSFDLTEFFSKIESVDLSILQN